MIHDTLLIEFAEFPPGQTEYREEGRRIKNCALCASIMVEIPETSASDRQGRWRPRPNFLMAQWEAVRPR